MNTCLIKKPVLLIAFLTGIFASHAQTVGVGTATPDNKAILDIVSANKGMLIPRIVDTTSVTNPVEGMIIFNKSTQTPYFYNGSRWLSLGGSFSTFTSLPTDKITYTINGSGFVSLPYPVQSLTHELTNEVTISFSGLSSGIIRFSDFSFTKKKDGNSTRFNRFAAIPTLVTSIEFKVYAAGAATPYISYQLKNIIITGFTSNGATVGDAYDEDISFSFENYGFKDLVNNVSFGYNVKSRQVTAY
ncbi:MAG: type VI secretion system tube protein Hcp [Chitinophagaceae bacterium]